MITNLPVNRTSSLASSKIDRTSFAVVIAALTSLEIASAHEMRTLAIVVLPHLKMGHTVSKTKRSILLHNAHPGGPQKMMFSVVTGASESSATSASGPVVR